MDTTAPPITDWPARIYPTMRSLVALASLSLTIDGYLRAGPPRQRASPGAIAGFEHTTGIRLDTEHRRFLRHANGWPLLWPMNLLGLPELRDNARMTRLVAELAATGELRESGLEPADVYPIAWAHGSGTAVVVQHHHDRAGEVVWFDGLAANVYSGFDGFFAAASERLLAVAGPLVGGRAGENDDDEEDR